MCRTLSETCDERVIARHRVGFNHCYTDHELEILEKLVEAKSELPS